MVDSPNELLNDTSYSSTIQFHKLAPHVRREGCKLLVAFLSFNFEFYFRGISFLLLTISSKNSEFASLSHNLVDAVWEDRSMATPPAYLVFHLMRNKNSGFM